MGVLNSFMQRFAKKEVILLPNLWDDTAKLLGSGKKFRTAVFKSDEYIEKSKLFPLIAMI